MDKWEKIVHLHRLLSRSAYSIPLPTILQELNCSEATFHRLRDYMQNSLGAPLMFDRKYKGYRYDTENFPKFELPGFWLTRAEIEALLCFDHTIETLDAGLFKDILLPLRNRFEPMLAAQNTRLSAVRERIKIIAAQPRRANDGVFRMVASAIFAKRRIRISHAGLASATITVRVISPQGLVRYRDNWYVDAFCHTRNALRTFAIDRITAADTAPGAYKTIPQKQLASFFAEAYGIFTGPADKKAIIDFSGMAAREVSRQNWHPKQEGQWIANTTFRLTVPYGNSRELVMDILRWGEEAQVLCPDELKNTVKRTIAGMLKKYEKKSTLS